jgi:hypothetical protein
MRFVKSSEDIRRLLCEPYFDKPAASETKRPRRQKKRKNERRVFRKSFTCAANRKYNPSKRPIFKST